MRNTVIYTYKSSPTILFQYWNWDPDDYVPGDKATSVVTDEEIAKQLNVELPFKEKNGVKVVEVDATYDYNEASTTYYIIPETHPYFNMPLILFSSDFVEELFHNDEVYALNDLFVDTIISR